MNRPRIPWCSDTARDFVTHINHATEEYCTCGGAGPGDGCPACEIYHYMKCFVEGRQGMEGDTVADMKPSERAAEAIRKADANLSYQEGWRSSYADMAAIIARETRCDEVVGLIEAWIGERDIYVYFANKIPLCKTCGKAHTREEWRVGHCTNLDCIRGRTRALLAALKGEENE